MVMNVFVILAEAKSQEVIQISSIEAILGIAGMLVAIGIPWGTLRTSVNHVSEDIKELKTDINDNIKSSLSDVRERFAALESKQQGLTQYKSPVSLTEKGGKALNKSGLKEYIDSNKTRLLSSCGKKGSMANPYDVQKSAFEFFRHHKFPKDVETKLKNYAFEDGTSMDSMRLIGGIYFRDICLDEYGFDPKELDKPKHAA